MKTLSLIAVSTLLGSVVSGQMIAPEKADLGSDFQEVVHDIFPKHPKSNPREIPESVPTPTAPRNQPLPKGKPEHKGPAVPLRGQEPAPNVAVPPVVHVVKTKTQIIYPTPNVQNWKNLPTAQGHRGKVVAEFYIDDMGHYREIKHHHGHGSRYSNNWVDDKKVVYGGPWRGSNTPSHYGGGGYKHKGSHDGGKLDYYHQRHGNSTHEEHRKGDYHHDDKQKHGKGKYDKEEHGKQKHDKNNEKKKHEKDAPTGTNKNDWKKKTAEGYQAKGIENIVAQNNASTPIEMAAADSAVSASASSSAPASAAQKTLASGSTSAIGGASAKNAAATSSSASHAPSSSSHSASSATSSTPASAASNTRQVALSFVAAVAATAVWCLA